MRAMKLNQIPSLEQANKTQGTQSASRLQSKQMKPLSSEEQELIQDRFPKGMNRKLELYLATGSSHTEQPAAKGQNFDFRV